MKEKKYLVLSIALVLLTFVGVSLAYFLTSIEGENKRVTISTSDLRIIFTNGDAIEGTEIEPGWSVTKTFSVENKTKNEYKYNIVIEDLINTFKTTGYLQYKITSTDGGYNMTSFEDVPKSSSATDTVLAYSVSIPSKSTQNYTITIQYPNDENVNQSIDALNNAVLTGKLYITEGTINSKLLTQTMLEDNPIIEERTDFSVANIANTTGTIYQTNKTEDESTVYYYSGNTANNWVKFGKYITNDTSDLNLWKSGDDMYWRIIRINEDGSIRLLYAGTTPDTTKGYIGISPFNVLSDDPMYVGYMYGTSGSLENNRANENSSTIKTFIDTWYKNNLLNNYNKYINKTAIYCNDRSIGNQNSNGYIFYSSITRLDSYTPTYKCGGNGQGGLFESTQAVADKFSASTESGGNGKLTYPIALMTVDELIFAGGINSHTSSPYPWYYINSTNTSITGSSYWLTLSPYAWDLDFAKPTYVFGNAIITDEDDTTIENAVRPVISLNSCVKVTGTGTPNDPYVVDYDGSCK